MFGHNINKENSKLKLFLGTIVTLFNKARYKLSKEEKEKLMLSEIEQAVTDNIINTEEYKKINSLYNKVIDNFIKICKEMSAKTPIEVYHLFLAFYHFGFFSFNRHKENNTDILYNREYNEIPRLYGIEVFTGYSVCRHSAPLLTDIFRKMGFESTSLIVYLKSEEHGSDADEKSKNIGNHIVSYVKYEGVNYLLCPENFAFITKVDDKFQFIPFLSSDDEYKAIRLRKHLEEDVKIISLSELPFNLGQAVVIEMDIDETLLENISMFNFLSKEEYKKNIMKAHEFMRNRVVIYEYINNHSILDKFYYQTQNLFSEIINLKESFGNYKENIFENYTYDPIEKKLVKRKKAIKK